MFVGVTSASRCKFVTLAGLFPLFAKAATKRLEDIHMTLPEIAGISPVFIVQNMEVNNVVF
jgi:hypothetical protein